MRRFGQAHWLRAPPAPSRTHARQVAHKPGFSKLRKCPGRLELQSHLMRHQCDIKATPRPVDSQGIATPMRPQCDPKATIKPPQGSHKAPTKRQQSLERDHGLRTTDHLRGKAEGRRQNAEWPGMAPHGPCRAKVLRSSAFPRAGASERVQVQGRTVQLEFHDGVNLRLVGPPGFLRAQQLSAVIRRARYGGINAD